MNAPRLLLVLMFAARLVWPQAYSNKDLKLELRDAGAGVYSGTMTLEAQSYPVTARGTAAELKGEFVVGGNRFAFTARVDGMRMTLTSGGVDHVLNRENGSGPVPVTGPGTVYRHALGYSLRLAPGWTATDNPEGIILLPPGVRFEAGRNDGPCGMNKAVIDITDGFKKAPTDWPGLLFEKIDNQRRYALLMKHFGASKGILPCSGVVPLHFLHTRATVMSIRLVVTTTSPHVESPHLKPWTT